MKIDPVVIHDAANKRVEGEPEPVDKMGEETTLSWGSGAGTICPAIGRRWPIFLARYPAARSLLISFSWTEEAIHLPPAPDPDIFGGPFLVGRMNAWALGLRRKERGEQKQNKAWVERRRSSPL